ncbi:MAG: hypothetical protein RML46_05160 [Anaerolineae bacterium]|nr:hypothetical protein [Anaerolineae bacterium]MDW8068283.1 hypothetical protein [Anaerolineae bacterium]
MKKWLVIGILILAGILLAGFTIVRAQEVKGPCPPGTHLVVLLDPVLPGEQASPMIARRCEETAPENTVVVLEPLRPEELEQPAYRPTETSPIVQGPSDSPKSRCVVVLKPLEEGGGASEPVCGKGRIESVDGVPLSSLYLIARFYDNPNYGSPLIEYYGAYPCSAGYSYGRPDLRVDGVDNRFASGQGFSTCNLVTVYDFSDYDGPFYTWGPNCPTFHALNDAVSSWKITH